MQVVMLPTHARSATFFGMNRACAGEGSFFEVTFPGAFGQREVVLMELAILIALAALAVDIIDTMFNIGWSIYIERKRNKKEK